MCPQEMTPPETLGLSTAETMTKENPHEPTIQQQGRLRILVQLPGLDDPERLKNLLGRTAQMNFHLVDPRGLQGKRAFPGSLALPMADDGTLIAIERRVIVSGEHLEDSQATFQDNLPVVSFRFNQNGVL